MTLGLLPGPRYIGIVGSRRRNTLADYKLTEKELLKHYKPGDRIVSGGCSKGADRMAERLARIYQIPILIHYAAWYRIGKHAGFHRNIDIARDCEILIALPAEDRKGGTEDTIRKVQRLGKEVILL